MQPFNLDPKALPLRMGSQLSPFSNNTLQKKHPMIQCESARHPWFNKTEKLPQHKIFVSRNEPNVNQTRNLLIWSQTRYLCAMDPTCVFFFSNR